MSKKINSQLNNDKQNRIEQTFIIVFFVFSVIGLLLALISSILFWIGCDWAGAVGVFSTIISIILSVISLIYTYCSGVQTIKVLRKIENQNTILVKKISKELGQLNYNEENIENAFSN